jgi:hypothetical protein
MSKLIQGIVAGAAVLAASVCFGAPADPSAHPTFSKDIAPILQNSCQRCHNENGVAPMPLLTYQQVRPYAKEIKRRTGLRDNVGIAQRGVMPPWFMERNIGIQEYKDDTSLTDPQIAMIAKWVDDGAPEGNPADLPPAKTWIDPNTKWTLGTPDLVVSTPTVEVKPGDPDWWGSLGTAPTGLTEERYVQSVEIREVNDIKHASNVKMPDGTMRMTVGRNYVFHHMIWGASVPGDEDDAGASGLGGWPVHEVGRNADVFPADAGKLLKVGSELQFESVHLHSNGQDVHAHLLLGFKFFPVGYVPKYKYARRALGDGVDIDIHANEPDQRLDAYQVLSEPTEIVSFEPHLHAPGVRMCLEYIWGINVQTLSCTGYDHNWVRVYQYQDNYRPLLPAGTILHIIAYMDNTPANKNVPDSRDWVGSGNRSIANMFIDLGESLSLTDDEFYAAMAKRRVALNLQPHQMVIGCPLCTTDIVPPPKRRMTPPAAQPSEGTQGQPTAQVQTPAISDAGH